MVLIFLALSILAATLATWHNKLRSTYVIREQWEFVTAEGFFLWWLDFNGFDAWTSIWGKIYVRKSERTNKALIVHELVHVDQILRDGFFWQPIKYTIRHFWYGYRRNPYEVEAYKIQALFEKGYEI